MTVSMKVTWRNKLPDKFQTMKELTEWADQWGPAVRDALKDETPVRTGRMKQATRYSRDGTADGVKVSITAYVRYAKYVIYGTKPHIIKARAARYLRWEGPDGVRFARLVHHPGNKANDFPKRVLDAMKDDIVHDLSERIDRMLHGGSE